MKKWLTVTVTFLTLFAFTGLCSSQDLTRWELRIYYEFLEKHAPNMHTGEINNYKRIKEGIVGKIASKHGISVSRVDDIVERGGWKDFTRHEKKIARHFWERFISIDLPEGSTDEDRQSAIDATRREVARKYSITLVQLYDIEFRSCVQGFNFLEDL